MDFSAEFLNHTLLASVFALVWFGLPGLAIMRVLGLAHANRLQNWFLAPALGLSVFGSYSFFIASLIGFHFHTLILSWLSVLIILQLWHSRIRPEHTVTWSFSTFNSLGLLIAAVLWSLLPTLLIYPFVHQDALFVSDKIFDHAKVAIVDAIVREGLPPLNPYYAPEGERILLLYYYLWHFLAAQLKLLLNISGWQAEVAMSGFTAFATLNTLVALAGFCSQKRRQVAAWFVIVLAFLGTPVDLLLTALGHEWQYWVGYPQVNGVSTHGLELLWIQATWVPQHVFAALAIVILIFLISQVLLRAQLQIPHAIVAGFTASTAFGASTWVGGIALAMALPALIISALSLRLSHKHYIATLYSALIAVVIAGIVSIPLFISQTSGPAETHSQLPFGLTIYPSTNLFAKDTYFGKLMHVILFWLQFLPLHLGIAYLAGMFTLLFRKTTCQEIKHFYALSLGAVFGFLLIVLFLKSTFWNNTFAWRVVLVPVMLFMVWGAVGIADFTDKLHLQKNTWRLQRFLHAGQPVIFALIIMGITVGLLATGRLYHLPATQVSAAELAVRQSFLKQHDAWAKVREFVKPNELVQVNPDGYSILTPWPATLPYALFADRSIAYANVEYASVFAYRYDPKQNQAAYQLMQNIFSTTPLPESLQKLRDVFKVKAILVDKFDPVWASDAIEKTGIYQIVYRNDDVRIYLSQSN